jgi:heat shock protein 5
MIDNKGKPVAWTAVLYLFFIFLAPLLFLSPASAASDSEAENYGTVIGIDLGTTYS